MPYLFEDIKIFPLNIMVSFLLAVLFLSFGIVRALYRKSPSRGKASLWMTRVPVLVYLGVSLVFAVIFGVFTAQNRKTLPKKPKKEKKPEGEDTVAPVAELPAPAVEQTEEQPERQVTTQPEQLE
jgi:hypothetical protein